MVSVRVADAGRDQCASSCGVVVGDGGQAWTQRALRMVCEVGEAHARPVPVVGPARLCAASRVRVTRTLAGAPLTSTTAGHLRTARRGARGQRTCRHRCLSRQWRELRGRFQPAFPVAGADASSVAELAAAGVLGPEAADVTGAVQVMVVQAGSRQIDVVQRLDPLSCRAGSQRKRGRAVARAGFEPATYGLWARRAAELLYRALMWGGCAGRAHPKACTGRTPPHGRKRICHGRWCAT